MRGVCLGIARPAAPYIASSGISWPSAAAVILDLEQATLMQEITGASATTAAGVGDKVGSISNVGSAGGWLTAFSNDYRPTLRQTGGLFYLEDAGFASWSLLFNGLPATDLVSLFAAIEAPASWSATNVVFGASPSTGSALKVETSGKISAGAASSTGTLSGSTSYIIGVDGDRSGGNFRINGADSGSFSSNAGLGSTYGIGGASPAAVPFMGDKFYSAAAFQAAPSSADRDAVEAMLSARSGVAI